MLMIDVLSVGGRSPITAMRKTVMLSIAEIPRVIFSPESLGMQKTKREIILMRTAGRM